MLTQSKWFLLISLPIYIYYIYVYNARKVHTRGKLIVKIILSNLKLSGCDLVLCGYDLKLELASCNAE